MKITIKDVDINYIEYGKGKDVILLHGWGQNISMMKPIGDPLSKNNHIIIMDLPGFGESNEPKIAWNLNDYEEMLHEFIKKLKLKDVVLIGHSFGGRISAMYAADHNVSKLILLSSPLIKKKKSESFKNKALKFLKKIIKSKKLEEFMKQKLGSTDYKNASPIMREVLVSAVNVDLLDYANRITAPTLFITGDSDKMVPYWEYKKIEETIKDCGLIVYEDRSHYAYLEELDRTVCIIEEFIK